MSGKGRRKNPGRAAAGRAAAVGVRGWLLGLGVVIVVAVVVLLVATRSPAVPQPVAFNHLKHTQELGLTCEFCHPYVKAGAHAGLPDVQTCSACHQTRQGTSDEAARVTELIAEGNPLQFNKLFRMPGHVFYTHRRHVGIAELECQTCHGNIAESERPPARPLVRVTMDFCMECHREREATLDCNACHR